MQKRIVGIDVARALAVIGMILVNFKMVFGANGNEWLQMIAGVFDGKAAATFVVLAGVGIALMTNSAIRNQDVEKLNRTRKRIGKRAIFLFVVGLSYSAIWSADILHYYGVYMLITLLFLTSSKRSILGSALTIILAYPLLMMVWNYETGWDFKTLTYANFWTVEGFVRNLFYNGFHPVFPWTAFMLVGLWLGKERLEENVTVWRILKISVLLFIGIELLSFSMIAFFMHIGSAGELALSEVLGTSPMPPLPIYMLSGSSIAVSIICACILIARKLEGSFVVEALKKTGQLALTFYVAHVVLGMGCVEAVYPDAWGSFPIVFSLVYALLFSLLCVAFAWIWTKYFSSGPLEWAMRKLTD